MAVFRVFVVVCVFVICSARAQQCDQAVEDFHQCIRTSFKPGGQGQRPDFQQLKQKVDNCFTSNGCDTPKPGPHGDGGPPSGGVNAGSQGGHAGGNGGAGSDDRRKCFQSVGNQTKNYILQCVRKSDPSFSFPQNGPGGPGGEHHGFGRPPAGGPGLGFGAGGDHPGGGQFLSEACHNDENKASQVKACLVDMFPKPDSTRAKQDFENHCKAKAACEAKLGSCKDVLEKRRQALCTCGQDARSKRQEFQQQEPSCAKAPQGQNASRGGRGQGRQHDCSQKPKDPCEGGFDAFQQASSHRRPGGN